jgi:hypothetical protein
MKRHFKTFVVAAATLTATTLQTIPAEACGKGGGGRGGFSVGYGRVGISVSRAPVCRTVQAQPRYVQPQPVYAQPVYAQPIPPQPIHTSQRAPVVGQQGVPQSNPVVTSTRPAISPPNTAPAVQQPLASGNAAPANTASTNEASALQMLASISTNDTSPTQSTAQIPQFTAATSATSNPHTGTWKVNLPGNQSVELLLNDDSSFRWTATKDGKSSSFQGQFRLENGRLTLVRSNDLQQMTGTWSGQDANFTFKLDGATTSGLAFIRS